MYNANIFIRDYKPATIEAFRAIRERECTNYRDAKARKMMEALNEQRKEENNPSPRHSVLTCSRMEHLPKLGGN